MPDRLRKRKRTKEELNCNRWRRAFVFCFYFSTPTSTTTKPPNHHLHPRNLPSSLLISHERLRGPQLHERNIKLGAAIPIPCENHKHDRTFGRRSPYISDWFRSKTHSPIDFSSLQNKTKTKAQERWDPGEFERMRKKNDTTTKMR